MLGKSVTRDVEGVVSLLDTDLVKITMQSAVLQHFPAARVTYTLQNRTTEKRLTRAAFTWLEAQISRLGDLIFTDQELSYLQNTCPYLSAAYLEYLRSFRLDPAAQVRTSFRPLVNLGSGDDVGELDLFVEGLWVDVILYEVPLLALICEAYFRFVDTAWTHNGQLEKAYEKGMQLLHAGCDVAEYGTRRRRDFQTQELVVRGLAQAQRSGQETGLAGIISGTSNVHLAMKYGIPPKGSIGHEWFMGVAAISGDYTSSTNLALSYWLMSFGEHLWRVTPTDTLSTPVFLEAFQQVPSQSVTPGESPLEKTRHSRADAAPAKSFAAIFAGVRQDSGDPAKFIQTMRKFYAAAGIQDKKVIVFSDALTVELCLKYKTLAEAAGFDAVFGMGTSFTNDFVNTATGQKSAPLNVVCKLVLVNGRAAIKISDSKGKHSGDKNLIEDVKRAVGYREYSWEGDDESRRWTVNDEGK